MEKDKDMKTNRNQEEPGNKKKPYRTPRLKKLGTAKEATQGLPDLAYPDIGGWSK